MPRSLTGSVTLKAKFILSLLVGLAASDIHATSYFVAANGNDSNPGTQALPWATVKKVNSFTLAPGDAVYFQGGETFCGTLQPRNGGTAVANVYFESSGNSLATISGCGSSYALLLNHSYTSVSHLIFLGGSVAAATVSQASYVTFDRDQFQKSAGPGLFFWGPNGSTCNHLQVTNSLATENTADGIADSCAGDSILIQGNSVNYNVTSTRQFGAGIHVVNDGTNDAYRQTNVQVLGNRVYYNGIGSGGNSHQTGNGIHIDTPGTGLVVSGNDCEYNVLNGIEVEWTSQNGTHLIQGNTAVGNSGRGIILYQRSWNVQIIQNTAYDNHGNIFVEGRYGGDDVGMVNNYVSQNWTYDPAASTGGPTDPYSDVSFGAVDGANNDGKNGHGNTFKNNCWGKDNANYARWGNSYYTSSAALTTASAGAVANSCTSAQLK